MGQIPKIMPRHSADHVMDKYGNNPDLRKEIRNRRDHWYELCERKFQITWPIGLEVPLLDFYREISPGLGMAHSGIQFIDKDPSNKDNPPLLYISIHFKTSRYFAEDFPDSNQKWLHIQADMRFAFSLRIQVRASNLDDELEFRNFLRKTNNRWLIQGYTPEKTGQVDRIYFCCGESMERTGYKSQLMLPPTQPFQQMLDSLTGLHKLSMII